jgi:hypothetical protein
MYDTAVSHFLKYAKSECDSSAGEVDTIISCIRFDLFYAMQGVLAI